MLNTRLSNRSGHFEDEVNILHLKSNRGFSDVPFVAYRLCRMKSLLFRRTMESSIMYSCITGYIRKGNFIEKRMLIVVKFDEDVIYTNVKYKPI